MIPQRFLRSFTKREFLGLYEDIESGDTHVLPKESHNRNGDPTMLPDGTPVTPADITTENLKKWFVRYGLGGVEYENKPKISELRGTARALFIGYSGHWNPDDNSPLPLSRAPKIVPVDGYLLMRDTTPAVKNAAYLQVKHMLSPNLGVQAHYMKSLSDSDRGGRIANVLGLGASLRLGSMAKLTGEWGRNASDFARAMHHGSVPGYRILRLDYGMPGSWKRGDWNAFFDYKRFEHGSFLGGNGTESLPDRYLDGIESFTLGLGCVPADNLRVELFYTFGARSTSTRETVFTAEKFKLGDFARVQITYKF